MDKVRTVYIPKEISYKASPLEGIVEEAVMKAGGRLNVPMLEFFEGSTDAAPELIVTRGCIPKYVFSLSYRKRLTLPMYKNQSGVQQLQLGKPAMPLTNEQLQHVLTSKNFLCYEAVLFRRGSLSKAMDFINLPFLDGMKDMLNDYYTWPEFEILHEVEEHLEESNPEFTEIINNCFHSRNNLRCSGVHLSEYAARTLMDEIANYALSASEESSL